jgi:hypothetical protein
MACLAPLKCVRSRHADNQLFQLFRLLAVGKQLAMASPQDPRSQAIGIVHPQHRSGEPLLDAATTLSDFLTSPTCFFE